MQQRTRRLAIVFAASVLASLAVLAACSTDNGTTPTPSTSGKKDADKGDDDDDDDDSNPDGSKPKPADAGADCSEAPRVRTNSAGFFCSFFTRDAGASDAGGKSNCGNDETCCNPGKADNGDFPPSFCASTPVGDKGGNNAQAACSDQAAENGSEWHAAGSSTWECGDKNNCDDGQVCCMFTWADAGAMDKVNIGKSLDKAVPAACGALQAFKQGGTRCAASCAADEIRLCGKTDDSCTGSQKCTPFAALYRDLATCRQ